MKFSDIQVGRDTHLRWSRTDDYPFAVQRYHLSVKRLVEGAWVSTGLILTLVLMVVSKQPLDNPSDSATWPPWRTLFICFSAAAVLVVAFQWCFWPLITGRQFALENVGDDSSYVCGLLSLLVLFGRTWLLAPVCEELLFRTCLSKGPNEFPRAVGGGRNIGRWLWVLARVSGACRRCSSHIRRPAFRHDVSQDWSSMGVRGVSLDGQYLRKPGGV